MPAYIRTFLSLLFCATLIGCSSPPTPPPDTGGSIHERNQAYSLLYKLMTDESDVNKIFILKSASDPLKNLIKEIASAAQSAKKQLDTFSSPDSRIDFNLTDLPQLEQRSRDLQAKEDEHTLLFSSGKDFELNLIFTQLEAVDYGKQLCKALLEKESDPTRRTFLSNLANQCDGFHDRLMKLLSVQN
jgi:hypothetical protein